MHLVVPLFVYVHVELMAWEGGGRGRGFPSQGEAAGVGSRRWKVGKEG